MKKPFGTASKPTFALKNKGFKKPFDPSPQPSKALNIEESGGLEESVG